MVVSQQLRLESCSPPFCGQASISHHHLVYKTPRKGLTSQTGPGGEEQDGLHGAVQAATASPRQTLLCPAAPALQTPSCPHESGSRSSKQAAPLGSALPPHLVLVTRIPLTFTPRFGTDRAGELARWHTPVGSASGHPPPSELSGWRCHGEQPQLRGSCVWAWKNILSFKGKTEL